MTSLSTAEQARHVSCVLAWMIASLPLNGLFSPAIPCPTLNLLAFQVRIALKPLIARQPYIIKGSKDLVIKLSKIKLPRYISPNKRPYILTGDIVAYYPNLDRTKALARILEMWTSTVVQRDLIDDDELPMVFRDIFMDCLELELRGEEPLQFDNNYYKQVRGVAMGRAASPDIANLYAAYDENAIIPAIEEMINDDLLFYGRFIDDCLMIVLAESAENALEVAQNLRIEGVALEWECNAYNAPFLDLFLMIDPLEKEVVSHRPFKKAGNNMERLPWISNHPQYMKKGTIIGEISRLATLSSNLSIYLDSITDLANLYIDRGYPDQLVHNLVKEHASKRWTSRLDTPKDSTPPLVMKSKFNEVWTSFPIHDLEKTVNSYWKLYGREEIQSYKPNIFIGKRSLDEYLTSTGEESVTRKPAVRNGILGSSVKTPTADVSEGPLDANQSRAYLAVKEQTDKRLILSLARTKNLRDLMFTWRKQFFKPLPKDGSAAEIPVDHWV